MKESEEGEKPCSRSQRRGGRGGGAGGTGGRRSPCHTLCSLWHLQVADGLSGNSLARPIKRGKERSELGLGQGRSQSKGRSGHGKEAARLGEGFPSNKVEPVSSMDSVLRTCSVSALIALHPPQCPAPTCAPLKAHAGGGDRK